MGRASSQTAVPSLSLKGLSPQEVELSKKTYGINSFTQKKRASFLHQFLESFGDPIIKILMVALAINILFLFRTQNWFETAGIAFAVFLATFVSTLSEYGSESAFLKLQADAAKIECRVRRMEGVLPLPVSEVVVGDLVLLQAGERIPADGLLISGELHVDQSALNGESKETTKIPLAQSVSDWDLSHKNQLFRGSVISSGEGVMVVRAVGDSTFYGKMAVELQEQTRESPLKVKLGGLAASISRLGYRAAALVAFADLFNAIVIDNHYQWASILLELKNFPLMAGNLLHAALLSLTVVVVAVPEGLPMMITVVLSSNMFRMLKDHVMVRKLVGIETAGSLNILFTDKTGTLTGGNLRVMSQIGANGKEYRGIYDLKSAPGLLEWTTLSGFYNTVSTVSNGKALGGNATDRALLDYLLPVKKSPPPYEIRGTLPFSSASKYSAACIHGEKGKFTLWKGAPEKLLSRCKRCFDPDGNILPFHSMPAVRQKWQEMTTRAIRVILLAVSEGELPSQPGEDLIFIGLIGIRDQLRPEVKKAVELVRGAGVQTVMVTGDNRETAAAIAKECGLLRGHSSELVLTGKELAAMDDPALKAALPSLRVVARALPSDKSRLVRLAQELGLVVGMTGDGVNDAPALKKADVGFAMGSGTEVAKEAGDIVILDDHFASIVKAILYGRTIFKSIRKFIVFQLTMNLCAVGVSLIGPFIGIDTPVTVIQMLWINMIMDTLAGLAFAGEPPLPEYMREKPKSRSEAIISREMRSQILFTGLYTVGLCIAFLKLPVFQTFFRYSTDRPYFMTAFFALFVFAGIFNSFNARTHRLNLLAHLVRNPSFITIMALVAGIQLLLIYYGGSLFRTAGLTLPELKTVLLIALTVVPADLLRKCWLRLHHRSGAF